MSTWNILYRGSLSSCNYACGYCPFAKTTNTVGELRQDQVALERFVDWVGTQQCQLGILITPWGEALVHRYYRRAMVALSRMPHVYRVAVQTNLSAPVEDFEDANRDAIAFWTTFHPSQTSVARFLARCDALDLAELRYSVGVVGLREHFDTIEELRLRLRPEVYLWINAYKRQPGYYHPGEIERMQAIDPYFRWNLSHHPSAGAPCNGGEETFTVDENGDVRRCHFISEVIGNIYDPAFRDCLRPRKCTAATCGCHIGYAHLPSLRLGELYGSGILERIPSQWPEVVPNFTAGKMPTV